MTNTYACKNAIRSSKNIIAVTIIHGKIANPAYKIPEPSNVHENPIKIFNNACPLIMLANNRMLKLKIRAI